MKLKKIKAIPKNELEKIIGGISSYAGQVDCKDCTSGLGSGESNTDSDGGINIQQIINNSSTVKVR